MMRNTINQAVLKRWQIKHFNQMLHESFDQLEGVDYTDEYIQVDEFIINYRLVNRDILSNYSSGQNIIYINPMDASNIIRLNILIKQALRYRKKHIPWL
jgi:hypothetical protein